MSSFDKGVLVPMPIFPSFLTNNNEVEAELITLKAAVAEVEPLPAIVVLANNPVLVPMPTLLELLDEINNVEVAVSVVPLAA